MKKTKPPRSTAATHLAPYDLLAVSQWAKMVGVTRTRAYEWIRQGRLRAQEFQQPDGRIVLLVPVSTPRPEPRKPGRKRRAGKGRG